MKNNPTPEQAWVAQTLGSLQGATRPTPSPWLYQQVCHRLATRQVTAQAEAPDWSWVLKRLAFAVALVTANLLTFTHRADFTPDHQLAAATQEYSYHTLGENYY